MNNKNIGTRYSRASKKQPFQNSWSITLRKPLYDALGDPHASYYFLNKSMRKHLKSLKKSIQKQGAFVQRKKIRNLIGQRIRDYDSRNMSTKVEAYYFHMKSSPSISSINSKRSNKQLANQQNSEAKQKTIQPDASKVKRNSKTISVRPLNRQYRKSNQINLPKIQADNKEDIKTLQQQVLKTEKQQIKINKFNNTEHNKFLKFIMEKKKKLQPHLLKSQRSLQIKKQ